MHRSPQVLSLPLPALPALLALVAAALAAGPARAAVSVAIDKPLDGDILASPIAIAASASTDAPKAQVTGWHVYVDRVLAYGTDGPVREIATSIPMDNGDHEVIVRAWDSTGDYNSAAVNVTIGTCSGFTVELQSPDAGSVASPVRFAAVASSCHRITGFAVYVDDRRVYQQAGAHSLDTSIDLAAGSHSVQVRATDSTRASASSAAVAIEVEGRVIAQPPSQPRPGKPPASQPPPRQPPPAREPPAQPPPGR
jgi:hypothetical protein